MVRGDCGPDYPAGANLTLTSRLNYLAPWLFVLWWLLTPQQGALRFADVPKMLLYPLVYLIVVMNPRCAGARVPLPHPHADTLGYGQVAIGCLGMLVGFVVIYVLTVAIDRWLGRRQPPASV